MKKRVTKKRVISNEDDEAKKANKETDKLLRILRPNNKRHTKEQQRKERRTQPK